jgi:hypothetical protein
MKLLSLIFLLTVLSGCTNVFCRPMGVGLRFSEWEILRNELSVGNYQKECIYTSVMMNGEYTYDCSWETIAQDKNLK